MVFAHHLLHDEEYNPTPEKEIDNREYSTDREPALDEEEKLDGPEASSMVFAHHLLHDEEYATTLTTPKSMKCHIKDNLTLPINPPACEFDMAIDPPHEEASFETFAHHLLHEEEYEALSPKSEVRLAGQWHLMDNFEPPDKPPLSPCSHAKRHLKDNYVPPETPLSNDQAFHSSFGSISYAGHFEHIPARHRPPL